MSDAQSSAGHEEHESLIKTPKQLIWTVVAAFVVPVVLIIMLANFVSVGTKPGAGSEGMSEEAVARRIQPVGRIEIKDASDLSALKNGEQVFNAQCGACHATGAAGAPKAGDAAAWAPRIKTGLDAMLRAALNGKNAMPKQGGGEFSDYEIARAVVFLANKSGAKFDEPKAPAAPASAAK